MRKIARNLIAIAGGLDPSELRPCHAAEIQRSYRDGIARSTKNVYDRCLIFLLKVLEEDGAPALGWSVARTKCAMPRIVQPTAEELAKLHATPDPALRFMIAAGSDAALRWATALNLKPRDIVDGAILTKTKAGGTAHVPLSSRLTRCLMALPETITDDNLTIVQLLTGKPNKNSNDLMRDRFRSWLKHQGIRPELRFHDLRRGLARRVYAATGDVRTVQSLLAHRSLNHTLYYLHAQAKPIEVDLLQRAIDGEPKP